MTKLWNLSHGSLEGLPSSGETGRAAHLLDVDRGAWVFNGADWFSLRSNVRDVRAFGARGDLVVLTDVSLSVSGSVATLTVHAPSAALPLFTTGARTLIVQSAGPSTYEPTVNLVDSAPIRTGDYSITLSSAATAIAKSVQHVKAWLATDDTANIQAALDQGGHVYFPPGNYLVTSSGTTGAEQAALHILTDRVSVSGAGGATIWRLENWTSDINDPNRFQQDSATIFLADRRSDLAFTGLAFRGFQVDGVSLQLNSGSAITLLGCERVTVSRCTMLDGFYFVQTQRKLKTSNEWHIDGYYPCRDIVVSDNIIRNTEIAIVIDFTRRFVVTRNMNYRYERSSARDPGTQQLLDAGHIDRNINIRNSRDGQVSYNILHGATRDSSAINLASNGESVEDVSVFANVITGTHHKGVDGNTSVLDDNEADETVLAGSIIVQSSDAKFTFSGRHRNVTINGNVFYRGRWGVRSEVTATVAAPEASTLIVGTLIVGNAMRAMRNGIELNEGVGGESGSNIHKWRVGSYVAGEYVWPTSSATTPGRRYYRAKSAQVIAPNQPEPSWPLSGDVNQQISNNDPSNPVIVSMWRESGPWPWVRRMRISGNMIEAPSQTVVDKERTAVRARHLEDLVISANLLAGGRRSVDLDDVDYLLCVGNWLGASERDSEVSVNTSTFANLRRGHVAYCIYTHGRNGLASADWQGTYDAVLSSDMWISDGLFMTGPPWQTLIAAEPLPLPEAAVIYVTGTNPPSTSGIKSISGGRNQRVVTIRFEDANPDLVIQNNASGGNIVLQAGLTVSSTGTILELVYDAAVAKWLQLGRSAN